jgi:hypothetical protein
MSGKVKGVVDLVILLDVTGSMGECLNAVKANIQSFIHTLSTKDANNESPVKDWRIRVCGYRDYAANQSTWFVDHPFVRTVPEVQAQLNDARMDPGGGMDEPESLLDALFKVTTIGHSGVQEEESPDKWRAPGKSARVIVFFTDATFHRQLQLPEGAGGGVDDLISQLQHHRIRLVGFAPEWSGYFELGSCEGAQLDNYISGPIVAHIGQDSDAGVAAATASQNALASLSSDAKGFQELMKMLAKTVSAFTPPEEC